MIRIVQAVRNWFSQLPRVGRYLLTGMIVAGSMGAVAGFYIGYRVHPATAWAAALELGLPFGMLGMVVGAAAGAIGDRGNRPRGR